MQHKISAMARPKGFEPLTPRFVGAMSGCPARAAEPKGVHENSRECTEWARRLFVNWREPAWTGAHGTKTVKL